jgi:hypothetical protein
MKYLLEQSNELLTTHTGLALVGVLMSKTKLNQRLNQVVLPGVSAPLITNGDIAKSYVGLLCQGKNDFDHIEQFRKDKFFGQSLMIKTVPSSPTLRQRLDIAGGDDKHRWNSLILEESTRLLNMTQAQLTPCIHNSIPLDIDVSPFDNSRTKKEGVSRTYKGCDGYAPIFAYLGQEGYIVNTELREGKVHCQNGTPDFLVQSILYARQITSMPLLVRLDSGNDSLDNIKILHKEETRADYIIKRNLRRESLQGWLMTAQQRGMCCLEREGKKVYLGEIWIKRPGVEPKLRIIFKVIERTIKSDGQALLFPEIEVDTFWTSLPDEASKIVRLYEDHGTSEQFHSEIKSDMDMERLPSGKFETNQLILHLGVFAYNILRVIGQEGNKTTDAPLRKKAQRRRIRTVIQNLITLASRLVCHGRQWKLNFGSFSPWFNTFKRIYCAFT